MMKGNGNPPTPMVPDTKPITKEEILTQFAVIRTKDGRIAVQFPVLDPTTMSVDIPMAMELCGAGLQTLAEVVRRQLGPQEASRIAIVPPMPGLKV